MKRLYIRCRLCGRILKDNISKKLGYGPECLKKLKPRNKRIKGNKYENTTLDR